MASILKALGEGGPIRGLVRRTGDWSRRIRRRVYQPRSLAATRRENADDALKAGVLYTRQTLTPSQALLARTLHTKDPKVYGVKKLARAAMVSPQVMSNCLRGVSYQNVPMVEKTG